MTDVCALLTCSSESGSAGDEKVFGDWVMDLKGLKGNEKD